jgi:hypothetical protein
MLDTRSGDGIGQGDVYHILAPKCHGQDSASLGEYHPFRTASADPPGLVEFPAPVFTRIGGVNEQGDLSRTSGIFDPVSAVDEIAGTRFHAEPVESGLAERRLSAFAKVDRNGDGIGLERALESGLELSLGIGAVELGASDGDPRATTGRTGANVGRDAAVWTEREPDQLVARALATGQDARPLRNVRATLLC